jgi:hypothetical protein
MYQGDTFVREFLVEEDTDEGLIPVDFTGRRVVGLVRSHATATKVLAAFEITWPEDEFGNDDRSQGIFTATLDPDETSRFPAECVYDIQSVNDSDGKVRTWIYGKFRVIRETTYG